MTHIPSNPNPNDGERLLRSSLQRALLPPAPASIAIGVQQRLAALPAVPAPSRFLRGLMRYGSIVGVTVFVVAVIAVVIMGQPSTTSSPSVAPDRTISHAIRVFSDAPAAVSVTTLGIVAFLLYGYVSTELSRR